MEPKRKISSAGSGKTKASARGSTKPAAGQRTAARKKSSPNAAVRRKAGSGQTSASEAKSGSRQKRASQQTQEKTGVRSARSQRAYLRQLRMEQQAQQENEASWRRKVLPMWGKMLIAVAVVLVLMLVFFRVNEFEVSGNVRYTAEEVAEASGITVGDVLMGANKTQAASRILVKLPYVEQVVVSKVLPGTVCFAVRECQAAVAAESEFGTIWLMNNEGKLLERLDEDAEIAYPLIQGTVLRLPTAGDPADFEDAEKGEVAMRTALAVQEANLSGRITSIDVTELDQVVLVYEERLEVQVGDAADLAYKLQYMTGAIAKLGNTARGALDLSFASGTQAIFHPVA